jgi:hypothetical protein
MPQNPQMAPPFLLQIPQGFLCCNLFSAEFVQPWHIPKELVLVPQKMRLVLPSHLFECARAALHKFCTEQIAAQKALWNSQKKCASHLGILWHFGTNSTGMLKALHSHR